MRRPTSKSLAPVAALAAVALTATACTGNGLADVNLPGGANLGSNPYTVTADFTDALDLVRQASVKVDNVPVGQVEEISLGDNGHIAVVKMSINSSVHLPANATAAIDQTSLLGEKYVELTAPNDPTGTLADGATIPVSATSQGIEFEQVFGALSLLLNGGGVNQLHDIVNELDKALGGRTQDVRDLLSEADKVIGRINAHRNDIIDALRQTNHLAATLKQNRQDISVALRDLPAGLRVLANQRHQLVRMLNALGSLSKVTVRTVRRSGNYFAADLRALAPTLRRLSDAGSDLPKSLQILLTYPFPDSVLSAIKGDYLNAFITTNLNTPGGNVIKIEHSGPPSLLPKTSSATPGLPDSTIVTTPSDSATSSGQAGH